MLKSQVVTTFKLSDKFLQRFRGTQPNWGFGNLSYFTYKRTYAREKEDGTQEEFVDTLERTVNGTYRAQEKHCKLNGLTWNGNKAQISAQEMFMRMWEFKFLPPGRGLWMMGTRHVDEIGSAALNNCFSGDTEVFFQHKTLGRDKYIDRAKLSDLVNQEDILLLDFVEGKFEGVLGTVRSFGVQKLQNICFKPKGIRSNFQMNFNATANHRWILNDGTSTNYLKVGDAVRVSPQPAITEGADHNIGFAHGLIFGDGTRHTYYPKRHFIRLCGEKEQIHVNRLEKVPGYVSTTYPKSYNGDAVVTIISDENWKALPVEETSISYLNGFVQGWIAADSHKNPSGTITLDTSNLEAAEWITKIAPLVGLVTIGWSVENSPTNFGERSNPLNRITLTSETTEFIVKSIVDEGKEEEVFCPIVPNTNQFLLSGGLLTGNCGFVSTKDIDSNLGDPFSWSMDMLMLGVGIGFDTKGRNKVEIESKSFKTGDLTEEDLSFFNVETTVAGLHEFSKFNIFVIPDSREGWVESVELLINSYERAKSKPVFFIYDLVRKAGEPIRGFGGTSSGPGPLKECHESIRQVLESLAGKLLTSVGIVDIFNLIGKCVVAGNVRRSAELAIGEVEDTDYVEMKDYNKFEAELRDHRWASNNSVFVNNETDFSPLVSNILMNGEPGLIFLDNARSFGRFKDGFISEESRDFDPVEGFNPCAEQNLVSKELCCLVETFPSKHEDKEDFLRTLKFAYLYSKSVTLIPTHCEATNNVIMRNRRIGTSQSGIQQAMNKFGRRNYLNEMCDKGYAVIKKWDRMYSRWLGVPESIKTTTVKPSGTVSLLAGVWPGVHFTHSEFYFRTVRLAASSKYLLPLMDAGFRIEYNVNDLDKVIKANLGIDGTAMRTPEAKAFCLTKRLTDEDSPSIEIFASLGGTLVVYFPIKEDNFTKSKFDVSMWEQLNTVREMQHYWSDNAVSCTITIKEEEQKDLLTAIEYVAPYVKTLSFMPLTNHKYDQAPYIEVTEEEFNKYESSLGTLSLNTYQTISGSKFCDGDSCLI